MIIQSKKVYFEEKLQPLQIEIKDDNIYEIYQYNQFKVDVDYGDLMILPGLIDTHVHGYGGGSVCSATREWLKKWCAYLPKEGITSVVAGISCEEKGTLLKALKNIGDHIDNPSEGAHILGVYEEGPFISLGKEKGAQDPRFMIIPNRKVIDEFNNACNGHLIYVMIAPEMLEGNYDVIDYCRQKGMAVSLGHTGADFEICEEAIKHGANSFTHTYNGMKGLHHRNPGVVGAAMYFDNCYAELIADGVHVEKHAANILARIKGKDKLIIITDSIQMKGLPLGVYTFENGTEPEEVCADGVCRFTDGSGTLAGSVNSLNRVLRNAIKEEKIDFVTAINACTINPMKLFNINNKGLIKQGYKADLAIFDDDYNVITTYIDGKEYK